MTRISPIQNDSYQQSPEKNVSSINKVLRKLKITVNTRDKINTLVPRVHSLDLEINIFRAFCGMGRINNVFIPFSPMENAFPNSLINS